MSDLIESNGGRWGVAGVSTALPSSIPVPPPGRDGVVVPYALRPDRNDAQDLHEEQVRILNLTNTAATLLAKDGECEVTSPQGIKFTCHNLEQVREVLNGDEPS